MKIMTKREIKEVFHNLDVQTKRINKKKNRLVNWQWIVIVFLLSFILSFVFSFGSEILIKQATLIISILITLFFIFLGLIFDIIGVAVTSSEESIFHSMSSRKVKGAKLAVKLKKNADKVSSFCCDVIGDICGVISGAAGVTISALLVSKYHFNLLFVSLVVTAFISSLTIGGKAIGKNIAINKSNIILYEFAKFISIFYKV